MDDFTLNDGRTMPRMGLGTYQIPDAQVASVVRRGLDLGYGLVDTAAFYHNERGVGEGMRDADAFLTTKLWNDRHGDAAAALDESLALLGVEAVDLYLIHWPVPGEGRYVEAWEAMVKLREAGLARSIGVSNFRPGDIDEIVAATGVMPAVNQIELHPRFQQREARAYHDAHGIVTQSWSPLGQGGDILRDPAVARIAQAHGRSAAQVILAWHLARGLSVIPKAADPEHLSDNFAALELTLDEAELAAIDALDDSDGRIGPDPARFG
ncbi:aldo/keto reductase [uncultured Sphingomonas sp.]|uniref:aldo/keto reductase n=1 Tax=uncultured Sphingomonas sp. TaxID=158754 RepID=UPI0035CC750E